MKNNSLQWRKLHAKANSLVQTSDAVYTYNMFKYLLTTLSVLKNSSNSSKKHKSY